jgi:signal transduction histidine kinase
LVAREALRNAASHGSPSRISALLAFDPEGVRLEIADDGHGFDPSAMDSTNGTHCGIEGMRERIIQLGGSFQLRSAPGHGTSVIARVPILRHTRRESTSEGQHGQ